jgi:hypothetical protein
MKLVSVLLFSLAVLATPAAAKSSPQMPRAIQGTWYPNNSEGKKQCAAYRIEQTVNNRINALVITPRDAKSFSEYGEYTGWNLKNVNSLSRQQWKLTTTVEGDGSEPTGNVNIWAKLERGLLYWNNRPTGGSNSQYFKCL